MTAGQIFTATNHLIASNMTLLGPRIFLGTRPLPASSANGSRLIIHITKFRSSKLEALPNSPFYSLIHQGRPG